ncbi:ATP-binding protein [Cyclobacterium xiamenense]|uniref:ATP-binding protein n=1 Tax=Cyclobacterium xiamenense TaxID=1297121 RepID=UPI0012B93AA7|nr:ATP-binding protein [Cyclobacterium xiamenense]
MVFRKKAQMIDNGRILEAIGKSHVLLQQSASLSEGIQKTLAVLGEATGVDRIYIFKNHFNESGEFCMSYAFEWVAKEIDAQMDFTLLQALPYSIFPELESKLQKNQVIYDLVKNSKNKVFYEAMQEQNIIAYLFVPIFSDAKFWGYIGFDNCSTEDLFSREQVAALHALAATLGALVLNRKQKKRLVQSHRKYVKLINSINDVIFRLDANQSIAYINEPWTKISGHERAASANRAFSDFLDDEFKAIFQRSWKKLMKKPDSVELDLKFRIRGDGSFWGKLSMLSNFSKKGTFSGVSGSLVDITNEKEMLDALTVSDRRIKSILDNVTDVMYSWTPDSVTEPVFITENVKNLGLKHSSFLSDDRYWLKIVHPEDRQGVYEASQVLFKGEPMDLTYRIVNDRGKQLWLRNRAWVSKKDADGRVITISGKFSDITDLKTKELRLLESEKKINQYNQLLEAVNDTQLNFYQQDDFRKPLHELFEKILTLIDSQFGFMAEVLYDEQGAPYLKSHTITNIAWSDETEAFYQQNFQTGIEFRNLDTLFGYSLKTGNTVIANDAANDPRSGGIPRGHPPLKRYLGIPVYKDKQLVGLMGFANKPTDYSSNDIVLLQPLISSYANLIKTIRINREKEKAEQEREEANKLYQLISANSNDIIAVHELDMTISYISPSIYKLLGYRPEEVIGENPLAFAEIKSSSGDVHDLEKEIKLIVVHLHKYTGKPVYLETYRKPLWNENGEMYAMLATSRDVTERELMLEQLIVSYEKEKELNTLKSRFISMTSHELRTPMSTISSSNELLAFYLNEIPDPVVRKKGLQHVTRIGAQVSRLSGVIDDVLLLEKNAEGKIKVVLKEVDLGMFFEDFVQNFSYEQFPERPIKLLLPDREKTVKTDDRLLYHIVSNLVDNAYKYSQNAEKGPEIEVTFGEEDYCFCVKDYGIGIPKSDQQYIFDSFFRSKNVSTIQGTGLGLNIVREMVHKLNGTVRFTSEEGKGSTFNVTLPYVIR